MDDEFLLTNQLGGYSSSTFHSGNTRKYHGLLITAGDNLHRQVIVSQLEEKILKAKDEYYLSTVAYSPGDFVTTGFKNLTNFNIHPQTASFDFIIDKGIRIIKEINLAQEANTVIVRYKINAQDNFKFSISPLLTKRDINELSKNINIDSFKATSYLNSAKIQFGKFDELNIKVLSFNPKKLVNLSHKIFTDAHIYKNLYYREDALRKYDASEDLVNPLTVVFNIEPGESFISLQFSFHNACDYLLKNNNNALKLVYSIGLNKKDTIKTPLVEFKDYLLNSYHSFLIDSATKKSIIAGYPWFADWGRDTFISLPGLLLATGEFEFAKQVIKYWSKYINDGLIPNDLSGKIYNTIDASLWYIMSIYRYYLATSDKEFLNEIYPKVRNLLLELINGSSFSIQVDENGFLIWNDPQYSLTWMDSLVNGISATGRIGACVEIQMLWYNCLKAYEFMQKELKLSDDHGEITGLIKLVNQKFNKYFWNEKSGYAYDYIYDNNFDESIRPNVLMGLSLPFRLFDKKKTNRILTKAFEELYTPVGMLTLNKVDKKYNGYYQGSQAERDLAYHNGVIWPFLLGFYLKAMLVQNPNDKIIVDEVKRLVIDFWSAIKNQKLSYLPEVFAANDLHPDGCLSQAWNNALFLEVYQLLP